MHYCLGIHYSFSEFVYGQFESSSVSLVCSLQTDFDSFYLLSKKDQLVRCFRLEIEDFTEWKDRVIDLEGKDRVIDLEGKDRVIDLENTMNTPLQPYTWKEISIPKEFMERIRSITRFTAYETTNNDVIWYLKGGRLILNQSGWMFREDNSQPTGLNWVKRLYSYQGEGCNVLIGFCQEDKMLYKQRLDSAWKQICPLKQIRRCYAEVIAIQDSLLFCSEDIVGAKMFKLNLQTFKVMPVGTTNDQELRMRDCIFLVDVQEKVIRCSPFLLKDRSGTTIVDQGIRKEITNCFALEKNESLSPLKNEHPVFIQKLFNDPMKYPDVVFRQEDDKLYGHKAIIAQSKFFDTFFSTKLGIKKNSQDGIDEIDWTFSSLEILKVYVRSLYTNCLHDLSIQILMELIVFTQKVNDDAMNDYLMSKVIPLINAENAVDYFEFADTCKLVKVKEIAKWFVSSMIGQRFVNKEALETWIQKR